MKKKYIFLIILALLLIAAYSGSAAADDGEKNLGETIDEMLESIDIGALGELYENLPETLSGNGNITDYLKQLISGETAFDYQSISSYAFNVLLSGVKEKMPLFIVLFVLLVFSGITNAIRPELMGNGISDIVHFAIYAAIICTVTAIAYSLLTTGKETIDGISKTVQAVFPIILTLMSVTGTSSSVVVYSPAVAFISNIAVIVVENLIFPTIVFMMVIGVVSNINKSVKLRGLLDFLSGLLKWIIGLIVAIFSIFLTVKGLNAGIYDGISLRAVKYTINSSVPIVGGLIKDGFDMILASAVLIKNSLGVFAIILIFGSVLKPVLEIVVLSLCLKLVNAVTEPLGDVRANEFIKGICVSLNFVVAAILMISLMYLILFVMMIYSSQVIL